MLRLVYLMIALVVFATSFASDIYANPYPEGDYYDNNYRDRKDPDDDEPYFKLHSARVDGQACHTKLKGSCNGIHMEDFWLTVEYAVDAHWDTGYPGLDPHTKNIKVFDCDYIHGLTFCVDRVNTSACAYSDIAVRLQADYRGDNCRKMPPPRLDLTPPSWNSEYIPAVCTDHSQSYSHYQGMSILAPIIQCIEETMIAIFLPTLSYVDVGTRSFLGELQNSLRDIIAAMMALYVILLGYNVILSGQIMSKGDFIWATLKIGLVSYFALGSGIETWLPVLIDSSKALSTYVLDAATNINTSINATSNAQINNYLGIPATTNWDFQGFDYLRVDKMGYPLCDFRNMQYPDVFSGRSMALWDSIDCRFGTYFGAGGFDPDDSFREGTVVDHGVQVELAHYIPRAVILIMAAIPTFVYHGFGDAAIIVFFFAIMYFVYLLLIILRVVQVYIISFMGIVILGYFAPIAVPLALFDKTKDMYEAWLKQIIAFVMQPVLMFCFLALLFAAADDIMYSSNHVFTPSNQIAQHILPKPAIFGGGTFTNCYDSDTLGCMFQKIEFKPFIQVPFIDLDIYYYDGLEHGSNGLMTQLMKMIILFYIVSTIMGIVESMVTRMTDAAGGGATGMAGVGKGLTPYGALKKTGGAANKAYQAAKTIKNPGKAMKSGAKSAASKAHRALGGK